MTATRSRWLAAGVGLAALLAAGIAGNLAWGQAASAGWFDDGQVARLSLAGSAAPLLEFQESEVKFSVASLMSTLRDNRHEGWVLAAYPDPKTNRPLIGAGFSLDLPSREHPQYDPLNANTFVEPSSAELWAAAGLAPERLREILARFDRDASRWSKQSYRRRIRQHALAPELTEDEGLRLLRISAIQAIHNAKAYCRSFDQLTGSQQMALSQLVFQMGVNLEEFEHFLSALNGDTEYRDLARPDDGSPSESERWRRLQATLVRSEWARKYTARARAVIAMFDPQYSRDPSGAERRVEEMLPRSAVEHRGRKRPQARTLRAGAEAGNRGKPKAHKRRLA